MKKAYGFLTEKMQKVLPALAMLLAIQSVDSTCAYCIYQPDVPEALRKK